MKVIEIPDPINVKKIGLVGNDETINFKGFILIHTDTYSACKTPGQIRQIGKIALALEGEGKTFQLEDAEYELLKECIKEGKYLPGTARQLIPFYDAIDGAQDVKK